MLGLSAVTRESYITYARDLWRISDDRRRSSAPSTYAPGSCTC